MESAAHAAPDREFDRCWALNLLDAVLARLECEYADSRKARLFTLLKSTLSGDCEEIQYRRLAS